MTGAHPARCNCAVCKPAKFTVYDLKREVQARGSHFFDRDTMRFFGDTMCNFRMSRATIATRSGDVDAWCVHRRLAVRHRPAGAFAWFAVDDYRQVWPMES